MTQEEKELVIKDLCGRLQYGVIVQVNDGLRGIYNSRLVQVFCDRISCSVNVCYPFKECICIDSVKPYLRPMSSMTVEEKKVYGGIVCDVTYGEFHKTTDILTDWLNKNMFDYRDLIPNRLALVAPEGMYENVSDLMTDNTTQITVGCKIRSKTNPDEVLRIISDDCHGDKFECSNGSILSLRQINKHYDLYIEENKGTIIIS